MKKFFFTAFFAMISMAVLAQTRLYVNPKFSEIAKNQKIIAVLPFKATIKLRPRQMRDITADELKKMQKDEGFGVQSAMYAWFLKRGEKGKLSVQVQAPAVTNVKLKKANITEENMGDHTPGELAKILGVDAVIMGTLETTKPMSQGASAALQILFNVYTPTNRATLNLFIYNAGDSQMLLNYHKSVTGSLGSDNQILINMLMRKASRRIAYVSKK